MLTFSVLKDLCQCMRNQKTMIFWDFAIQYFSTLMPIFYFSSIIILKQFIFGIIMLILIAT
jgi:hypothetical protein